MMHEAGVTVRLDIQAIPKKDSVKRLGSLIHGSGTPTPTMISHIVLVLCE